MKNFKTAKGTKVDGVKIDDKCVYINLASGNLMKYAELAKDADVNDPSIMLSLSEQLFMPESFELVQMLALEDFVAVMDLVVIEVEKTQANIESSQKFKRVE